MPIWETKTKRAMYTWEELKKRAEAAFLAGYRFRGGGLVSQEELKEALEDFWANGG